MSEHPKFSNTMPVSEFLEHYWYKTELQTICRQNKLPTFGTKAELTNYLVAFLNDIPSNKIKTVRKVTRQKSLKSYEITPKTKLLNSGFSLNNEARQFFTDYFHTTKFFFKKIMTIKLREVQRTKDVHADVAALIKFYLDDQNHEKSFNNAEESTYQWNNFVRDFCKDPQSTNYSNKLKVAAILWQKVKLGRGAKQYKSVLIQRYSTAIQNYLLPSK
ncbi:SAP domain-containing protein [Loigolactobacillus iwatensis]|uniref:SAP domain-containing protein n=1 Tax=Loigolactobacillus iwatensis TaxID=1267156 RepID=UPI000F7DC0D9|nr:SAP domain-containing protein [Loigolactobacillus iwatensis]